MNKLTRAEAQAAGLTRYYTGHVCPNGHRAERYTSSGSCVRCADLAGEARRDKYRAMRANRGGTK